MAKLRAVELRTKGKKDLLKQLDELKAELGTLRVAQVTQGAASKLGKIKQTRKNIARVLTVVNQKASESYRTELKDAGEAKKPKALRVKKTRALRRALTKKQAEKKTVKAMKKALNFPLRKFAVKA